MPWLSKNIAAAGDRPTPDMGAIPPEVLGYVCGHVRHLKSLINARQASSCLSQPAADQVETLQAEDALLPARSWALYRNVSGLRLTVSQR